MTSQTRQYHVDHVSRYGPQLFLLSTHLKIIFSINRSIYKTSKQRKMSPCSKIFSFLQRAANSDCLTTKQEEAAGRDEVKGTDGTGRGQRSDWGLIPAVSSAVLPPQQQRQQRRRQRRRRQQRFEEGWRGSERLEAAGLESASQDGPTSEDTTGHNRTGEQRGGRRTLQRTHRFVLLFL